MKGAFSLGYLGGTQSLSSGGNLGDINQSQEENKGLVDMVKLAIKGTEKANTSPDPINSLNLLIGWGGGSSPS